MRLINFHSEGKVKLGALVHNAMIDVNAAAVFLGSRGPGDISDVLNSSDGLSRTAGIISAIQGKNGPWVLAQSGLRLAPPVPPKAKILAVALNYHDFCERGKLATPTALKVFSKLPNTMIGAADSIELPAGRKVTYEGELAVVIGRRGKNIPVSEAWDYIAGYSVLNDLTANDAAKEDVQLMRGKNFDTFCPIGPALVTKDEIPDPYKLTIKTTVNGVVRQDSIVERLIFKIPEIISYFASFLTLEPGDVIATGTPAGTALQFDPPAFLAAGDLVNVTISGVGTIANRVITSGKGIARTVANPAVR
jgi:2-keto-4-pentenoate hydratase/2-oxohepta-3-ene-1,7-dioic acid hydratase in catechol pathway